MTHDLVIRGGTVIDGRGSDRRTADVAVDGGVITEVGTVTAKGRRELNADGLLVTPGWVDIHTHYDGQATWDPMLDPSCSHGVTTVVLGNCGVGFAPVRPGSEDWLVGLMEGVEDIPGAALAEGITWNWETFPQYLDSLDAQPRAINIATQLPHGALRVYVMGERGADDHPPTTDELARMRELVAEAMRAGAFGVSTSRTVVHKAVDGRPVPGTTAAYEEMLALSLGIVDAGGGILELAPAGIVGEDLDAPYGEVALMARVSKATGVPVTFLLQQNNADPEQWRRLLAATDAANADGANVIPQVAPRPIMMLTGHESRLHAFSARPSYAAIADVPVAERVHALRDPELRARILAESDDPALAVRSIKFDPDQMYVLGDPPDYEPDSSSSVAARARAMGADPMDHLYELMLGDAGRELIMKPALNYSYGNLDAVYEMLTHPGTVIGGSDGGAHYSAICDASMPTSLLALWTRDRERGPRLGLEQAVAMQTGRTASVFGIRDRGIIAAGKAADINLIDYDTVQVRRPYMAYDLPAGARRLLQHADGYVATLVSGEVAFENGEHTGVNNGSLLRR